MKLIWIWWLLIAWVDWFSFLLIIITVILANLKADEIYEIRLEWAKNSMVDKFDSMPVVCCCLMKSELRMFWRNESIQFHSNKQQLNRHEYKRGRQHSAFGNSLNLIRNHQFNLIQLLTSAISFDLISWFAGLNKWMPECRNAKDEMKPWIR